MVCLPDGIEYYILMEPFLKTWPQVSPLSCSDTSKPGTIISLWFYFLCNLLRSMKLLYYSVEQSIKIKDPWEQRLCSFFFCFQFIEQYLALTEWFCLATELSVSIDEETETDLVVKLDGFILTLFTHPDLD